MSANRKPAKATDEEVREFYNKTKDVLGKTGKYYDPIGKKYRNAIQQDASVKGSGRPLIQVRKYSNFLKRLNAEEQSDFQTRESAAASLGFSTLQKARRELFGEVKQAAVGAAAAVGATASGMSKAEEAVPKPPNNVKKIDINSPMNRRKNPKIDKSKTKSKNNPEETVGGDRLQSLGEPGEKPAQKKLRLRGDVRADRVEEGKKDEEEQEDKIVEVDSAPGFTLEHLSNQDTVLLGETTTTQPSGFYMENSEDDEPNPVHNRRKGQEFFRGETKEGRGETKEGRGETKEGMERQYDWQARQGEDREPTAAPPPPPQQAQQQQPEVPLPQQPEGAVSMQITDRPLEVEIEKSPSQGLGDNFPPSAGRSYISPAAQSVSMERNRMKYSPTKLYEEIKCFIKIYKDDIKTEGFKKLVKQKVTEKSPLDVLRKLHRELEEEIIEYYKGKQGIRLGVIIDPSVLGININQLQGMMGLPLATGGAVREVGTQQRKVAVKDIHYHDGGLQVATKQVLPEGENLAKNETKKGHVKANRIKVPIAVPNRWLLKRSQVSRKPANLKIR
tara:strand:+ start:2006 stop:3682 length:1677 start_codon:yes stop_codon:yes gene_type:complete